MEQRIVNPELTDTNVTRRDVRAVPGGLVRAGKGGYSSNLEFSGDTFTATYVFDDPEVARIAATGGGERIMAWQVEDADANRQGLTISEFGELGGPGMGGCPAGPTDQAAPRPGTASRSSARATRGRCKVTWTPRHGAAGRGPRDRLQRRGRRRHRVGDRRAEPGRRPHRRAVDPDDDRGPRSRRGYDVEVRSLAGARMSEAFAVEVPAARRRRPRATSCRPR